MTTLSLSARDRSIISWLIFAIGILVTLGGMLGVWIQGPFYERGFPTAATPEEVRQAFTWPTLFTTTGSMIASAILLAAPLGPSWSPRRRTVLFLSLATFVVLATLVCGHLAMRRVAGILN